MARGQGIYGEGDTVRPLALRAETILSPGATKQVDAVSLLNPSGEPFELLEVRWGLYPVGKNLDALPYDHVEDYDDSGADLAEALPNTNLKGAAVAGSMIGCQFHLGKLALTSSPVPVWNFGPALNLGEEVLADWYLYFSSVFGGLNSHYAFAAQTGLYRWRLDNPLWIPPGVALVPTLSHLGPTDVPMRVGITYLGRVCPSKPEPGVVKVPWIAHWRSKAWHAEDRSSADQSPKSALMNRHQTPLRVERFVGRIAQVNLPSGDGQSLLMDPKVPFQLDDALAGYWSQRLRLTMRDSAGGHVIREPTPVRNVFGGRNRMWPCQHDLPPGSFYSLRVLLANDNISGSAGAGDYGEAITGLQSTRGALDVSMVGWRKVQLDF